MIWRTGPSGLYASQKASAIGIPRVGQGMATSLVTVHVPADFTLEGDVGGLRATSIARLETARADWMVRNIDEFIPKIDRGSSRDHQKLVTMLISHEMCLRAALRSELTGLAAEKSPGGQPPAAPGWIQAARAALAEAVRRAGLEPDLAVANRYLGEATANSKGSSIGVPEANVPERIRAFGRPISFMGILPGIEETPSKLSLTLERKPWVKTMTGADSWIDRRDLYRVRHRRPDNLPATWISNECRGPCRGHFSSRRNRRTARVGWRADDGGPAYQKGAWCKHAVR